jgi:Fe-S-cluster containining protein
MQNNEYICIECSRVFPTCCVAPNNRKEEMTVLSADEVTMMLSVTGEKNRGQYIAKVPNSIDFFKKLAALFPCNTEEIIAKNKPGAWHYRIGIKNDNRCPFLTETGCLLPCNSRPWFCRIYPFWVMNGKVELFTNNQCLALLRSSAISQVYGLFHTNEQEVLELYSRLKDTWVRGDKTASFPSG